MQIEYSRATAIPSLCVCLEECIQKKTLFNHHCSSMMHRASDMWNCYKGVDVSQSRLIDIFAPRFVFVLLVLIFLLVVGTIAGVRRFCKTRHSRR